MVWFFSWNSHFSGFFWEKAPNPGEQEGDPAPPTPQKRPQPQIGREDGAGNKATIPEIHNFPLFTPKSPAPELVHSVWWDGERKYQEFWGVGSRTGDPLSSHGTLGFFSFHLIKFWGFSPSFHGFFGVLYPFHDFFFSFFFPFYGILLGISPHPIPWDFLGLSSYSMGFFPPFHGFFFGVFLPIPWDFLRSLPSPLNGFFGIFPSHSMGFLWDFSPQSHWIFWGSPPLSHRIFLGVFSPQSQGILGSPLSRG